MPQVADFIERHREQLLQRFLDEASCLDSARGLRPDDVLGTLPDYLSMLAVLSRQGAGGLAWSARQRLEQTHISQRLRMGYTEDEVSQEYLLLGRLLNSTWEPLPAEQRPSLKDMSLLFQSIEGAREQVVATFNGYTLEDRQRERRTTRRLDTLAAELFGTRESAVPLRERLASLLDVIREAMGADGVELLLADASGGSLNSSATAGHWPAVPSSEALPVDGPFFASEVARSEEPLSVPDTTHAPVRLREALRRDDVRALLGQRLWAHGRLLGVLLLGLKEVRHFEPRSRRYFETLVEHLSGIVSRALLIEELRVTNAELRQQRDLYQTLLQAQNDVGEGLVITYEGRPLYINDAFCATCGYSREELMARPSLRWLLSTSDLTDAQLRLAQVRGNPEHTAHYETGLVHKDGHRVELEIAGKGLPDGSLIVLTRDITERKRESEAVRQSEDRLRMTLKAAELGTWDMDPETGALRWDERCKALFGLPPDAVVTGQAQFLAGLHPEDRERAEAEVRRALAGENGGEYDVEYRTVGLADGVERWVRAQGRVLFEGGRAVRFVGTAQDVSARKRLEEETRRRVDFEEYLIGIVSHDLRSPLNAISLSATALLRREGLDEAQEKTLQRLLGSAERANRMIRDLLDFTRARLGGGIPVEPRPLDLHVLTRQVMDEVKLAHPERRIDVVQRGPGEGAWDGDRLAQVLTNLVNNALAYSPPGTPVRVETEGVEGAAWLRVHNEGEPIPAELLPRLFEPLRRGAQGGDAASRSIGLGLFIVNSIVRAHGGTLEAQSAPDAGVTFSVRLPRSPPPA